MRNRLMLALILMISQFALSAHGFAYHNPAEFTQCELCVAQGGSDGDMVSADFRLPESAPYKVLAPVEFTPPLVACTYPAWTQRAPPGCN